MGASAKTSPPPRSLPALPGNESGLLVTIYRRSSAALILEAAEPGSRLSPFLHALLYAVIPKK